MILGIPFIRIDFRGGNKGEAGFCCQLFHERLLDVAVGGGRVLILFRTESVLFDAQNAARTQGGIGVGKGLLGDACRHPGVNVAHEQDQVGRARKGHRPRGRPERRKLDLAIKAAVVGESLLEGGHQRDLGRIGAGAGLEAGGDVFARALGEVGGEDLCPPAAAGPEFNYGHAGLEAEEAQGLHRMSGGVADLVLGPPGTRDGPFQRSLGRAVGCGWRFGGFFLATAGRETGQRQGRGAGE